LALTTNNEHANSDVLMSANPDVLMSAILSSQSKEIHQLKERNMLLIEQNKKKDDFLKIAVHELKGPIQPMINSAQLASNGIISDKEALDVVSQMSNQVMDLMSVILDSSKVNDTSFELLKSNVSIFDLLNEAKIMADNYQENSVPIVIDVKEDIQTFVDDVRLSQVFRNILNNAIKFTKKGFIHVTALTNKINNEIVITFSDSGTGIPSHMLANIFKQYSTDKTNNPDGTGLGLYICKEIIEKHGGTISAENNQLDGALFTIKLPLLPPTITIPNSTQKSCNDSTCNI